jgi:hypothetical protein
MEDPVMAATDPEAPGNERVPEDPEEDEAAPATEPKQRTRARGRTTAEAMVGR